MNIMKEGGLRTIFFFCFFLLFLQLYSCKIYKNVV